jgi:23S rRNA (guanine2445-N2)-methyltransferase / 23S rRNA (guanine2069-N7)-methyltransferase
MRARHATMAGVNVEGSLADAQRAVLWSRLASRVLWPSRNSIARTSMRCTRAAVAVDWAAHLGPGAHLGRRCARAPGEALDARALRSAARRRTAVVDVLRQRTGARPDVDSRIAGPCACNLVVRKGTRDPVDRSRWRPAASSAAGVARRAKRR